jgi:hypothetical protein
VGYLASVKRIGERGVIVWRVPLPLIYIWEAASGEPFTAERAFLWVAYEKLRLLDRRVGNDQPFPTVVLHIGVGRATYIGFVSCHLIVPS